MTLGIEVQRNMSDMMFADVADVVRMLAAARP